MMRAVSLFLLLGAIAASSARLVAQASTPAPTGASNALPAERTGADIYNAACVTCHAADGKGSPRSVVGFDADLPDFTDCAFSSAEADLDWYSVVHEGSPIRALGHHMPAFGDALSSTDIELAVGHVRTFCKDPSWPRGDLNLPRSFFTEKAFPENETVWATSFTGRGERSVANDLIYERRIGSRSQIEAVVPVNFQQSADGGWVRGLGDIAFAFKRTLYASMHTGRIAAAGAEVILPTGKESSGLGNGYTVVEPFAMWGQILPRNFFLQMHGGAEFPTDSAQAKEAYVRTALGTTFFGNRGFGRAWSPQVEVLWARPEGGTAEWDIVPQLQITLSKLQHVMVAGGVRIPVNDREARHPEALIYLLWDWYDGSIFDFWK